MTYCSSCGAARAQGLSYCNHCGAKQLGEGSDGVNQARDVKPESLIWGMAAALVFGFVAIVFLMLAMKMVGFSVAQTLALTILSFLIMLLVEGVFVWQLMHRRHSSDKPGNLALTVEQTKELDDTPARMLEPMPSVTEHTTRAFAPAYSERKPK